MWFCIVPLPVILSSISPVVVLYNNYSETSEQQTLWDQYNFKWILPWIEVVLFKRFQSHHIDREDKILGFSFVHCGEVYNTLSLYRRVLFERFHCI